MNLLADKIMTINYDLYDGGSVMKCYELEQDTIPIVWAHIKGVTEFQGRAPAVKQSDRNEELEVAAIAKVREMVDVLSTGDYDKFASLADDAASYYTRIPLHEPSFIDYWPERKARIEQCTTQLGGQVAVQFEIIKNDFNFEETDPYGITAHIMDECNYDYHQLYLFYYANSDKIGVMYDLTSAHRFNGAVLEVKFWFQDGKLFTYLDEFFCFDYEV